MPGYVKCQAFSLLFHISFFCPVKDWEQAT